MLYSFLITVREGFEIGLIVAIVLGYLARTGNRRHFREVWLGTAAAAALSVGVAAGLQLAATELSGAAREAFEGFTMLLAVGVLTWMVFWMRRQAASLGRDLRVQVEVALRRGSILALAALAFSAVAREGLETVLFLFAGSSAQRGDSTALYLGGGLAGFAVAAGLSWLVYRGSHVLPMRQFFTVTGAVVLVLAAGLLTNGIGALQTAGVIGNLGARPWDTDSIVSMASTGGQFLHTLIGYDSAPTWGQIVLYWAYLLAGLTAFVGGLGARPAGRPAGRPAEARH